MKHLSNHETAVIQYLKQGNELTVLIAMQKFKCGSLTAIISRLRKKGYNIQKRLERNKTNTGYHAVYFMK